MTEPVTMSFSLNEKAINAAIAASLPSLLKELEFDYVSGRAPKGLQASVTVTEPMIRKAVENYARRTVNSSFTHIGITFQATRGEEGQTANITASTAPIAPEEAEAPKAEATKAVEPEAPVAAASAAVMTEADAPFETDDELTNAPAESVVSDAEQEGAATAAPAPAGRSKLFATLNRPTNEAVEG